MKRLIAGALLAAATSLQAQPPADSPKPRPRMERMQDCAKVPDPKACEERRAKMRESMRDAHKACEGKQGPERRDCMRQQACARAKDPAQCEARAKERAERRKERMEKRGPRKPAPKS